MRIRISMVLHKIDIKIWDSEVRSKIQEWPKGLAIKFMLKIAFSLYVSPLGELTIFVEMKSKQIIVKTIKKSEIKNTNKCRL